MSLRFTGWLILTAALLTPAAFLVWSLEEVKQAQQVGTSTNSVMPVRYDAGEVSEWFVPIIEPSAGFDI